jgi:signal transduction histidine kinase
VVNLFHSTALRLGLAQAGAGILALTMLASVLWWTMTARLNGELDARVREDTRNIAAVIRSSGTPAALQMIDDRVGAGLDEDEILLLTNVTLHRLAGNLPAWPLSAPEQPGWGTITIARGGRFSQARVLHTLLPNDDHLLVGQDLQDRDFMQAQIKAGLLGATLMVVATGVIGIWLVRRRFVRRVQEIDATSQAIVSGKLQARLPVEDERDELDLLAATINRMLDQIEQLIGGVSNVSNAIAHDLRTPLAELRVRLETLLLDRQVSGHIEDEVEGAIDDTDRLITTFNAVLRLAELDSGAKRSGFTRVDASTIIAQAMELYAPVAETKSVTLAFRSAGPISLDGDPAMLAQAVANLLDNALKYAPLGSDILVTLDRHTNDTVALAVSDHGPGIPEDERPRAIERFFRGAGSAGTSGVGLGLSMVAAIARLHGGKLELNDNRPGLRATLLLPYKPTSQRFSTPAGGAQFSELSL